MSTGLTGNKSTVSDHTTYRPPGWKKVSGFKISVGLCVIAVPPCRYRVHGSRVKYKSTVWRNLGGRPDEERLNSLHSTTRVNNYQKKKLVAVRINNWNRKGTAYGHDFLHVCGCQSFTRYWNASVLVREKRVIFHLMWKNRPALISLDIQGASWLRL